MSDHEATTGSSRGRRKRRTPTHARAALTLPASAFYWGVIEAVPRPATIDSLRFAFEPFVPAPIDTVKSAFVRPARPVGVAHTTPIVACAIDRTALSKQVSGVAWVVPDALPSFLCPLVADADTDELLWRLRLDSGATWRSVRWPRCATAILLSLLLCAALLAIGMTRRAGALDRRTDSMHESLAAEVAGTLGPPRGAEAAIPPITRLGVEVRRLARTRGGTSQIGLPVSIADAYVALLAAWPDSLPTQVDQIEFRGGTLTIRGTVRDPLDFERLKLTLAGRLSAAEHPTGSTSRSRDGYRFDLAMSLKPIHTQSLAGGDSL